MSCCSASAAQDCAELVSDKIERDKAEALQHAQHRNDDGTATFIFNVPGIRCGGCIATIEHGLAKQADVVAARVNMSLKRVSVTLTSGVVDPSIIQQSLGNLGYDATPMDLSDQSVPDDDQDARRLLKALGVAGFAAANVMLLSVSVWSGATGATRDLFHLISAIIAIPATAYAGQVFFQSAGRALRAGRLNMDVPISLAVILAVLMSLFETVNGGAEAYFDAALTLLFFLLIGRYLDQRMRDKARNAVVGLSRMVAKGATAVLGDGTTHYVTLDEIKPGTILRIPAGARIPVDAVILTGAGDLDRALVTGESMPVFAKPGMTVEAGILNLNASLDIKATKTADTSFLSEVMQMMSVAEQGRGAYVRVADRMAQIYAPAVHILAALTFLGWLFATGGDWKTSLYTAIAVLIITCPCALGLAVPVVHVIGAGRLFEAGILMKDGGALERMAEVDRVVLDKTGTLTTGLPEVTFCDIPPNQHGIVAALADRSDHPASRAISAYLGSIAVGGVTGFTESPGNGIEAQFQGKSVRLGRADWVAEIATDPAGFAGSAFAIEGGWVGRISYGETLRKGAIHAVELLQEYGLELEVLSGDAKGPVGTIAQQLGVLNAKHDQQPLDKINRIAALHSDGAKVLMIGDGLNDAPSLAAGHASMAPASASDVGRMAADFIYTRDDLMAVPFTYNIAKRARALVRQNFALALIYNCIAVPLAMAGFVTPLFAAIAMSGSSIVVVANSLRLTRRAAKVEQKTSLLPLSQQATA